MIIFAILVTLISVYITIKFYRKYMRANMSYKKDHFLVTGGSSGIGLAFAICAVQKGASVTLLARNKDRLTAAKHEVLSHAISGKQKVSIIEADVSADVDSLRDQVKMVENEIGPITFLVNCAGTSVCYRFEETPLSELHRMMNINYFGSVYVSRAVLPLMKNRKHGKIIFVSSLAGIVGLYGYSAYSASKFALVGMAEALQMEVKPFNIGITVSFPPDTDTPGYEEEEKSKLLETKLICESGGLFSALDVAKNTLKDAMDNKFMSTVGFDGTLLCTLASATTAASSYVDLLFQVLTLGFLRICSHVFLTKCEKTIMKCSKKLY